MNIFMNTFMNFFCSKKKRPLAAIGMQANGLRYNLMFRFIRFSGF